MRNRLWILALALTSGGAIAQDYSIGTSGSLSTGRYGGTQDTRVAARTTSVQHSLGNGWSLGVTLPYMVIDSGADAALSINGAIVQTGTFRQARRGAGDPVLKLSGPLLTKSNLPFDLRFDAWAKMPVGSAGLTSGQMDKGATLEVSRKFGIMTPYVGVGYRMFGDSRDMQLANGFAVSAGSMMSVGKTTLIASYERANSPMYGRASQELFAAATGPLAKNWSWALYGSRGLNEGAADMMVGLATTHRFGRR